MQIFIRSLVSCLAILILFFIWVMGKPDVSIGNPVQQADYLICNSGSDLELQQCSDHKIKKLEAQLNELYIELEKLAGKYDQEPVQHLKEARQAWKVYVQKECEFASDDVYHGSAKGTHYAWCIDSETRQRIVEVKELIHNFRERS